MFDKPNTTPFPDDLIDRDLKNLSGSEFKLIAFIIRKTFGFHKAWDFISRSQIKESTGLGNSAITNAIQKLESEKYIKSEYVCPKCDLIVKYNPPEKRKGKRLYSCPSCHTEESPNKWYALNISGQNMEKYLKETLKIKANNPNKKGSPEIRLPHTKEAGGSPEIRLPHPSEVVLKPDYGSPEIRLPLNFQKDTDLVNDDNILQGTTTQRGSIFSGHTINNTTNNVQKTSSSGTGFKISTVQPEIKKEKDDVFLNLSEEERTMLIRIENYLNSKCQSKWKEGLHCEKYPDRQYRILIVKSCIGKYPFVRNTIDGKILEVEKESLLDEFVYKSIMQSLKEGEDHYGK